MGISKTQLMSAVQKLKDYTDNALVGATISADFLTDEGFGGLRYHNGVIQYWNGGSWIDAAATSDNTYIINMSPQPMKAFIVQYNSVKQKYQLKWTEPDDTVVDGQTLCTVDGVIIRRKLGSAPADEKDGTLVIDLPRRQFGSYKTEWYDDDACAAQTDDVWYYKAFPYSTLKFYGYSKLNEGSALCKDYELYAFKINQTESNPASMITYPIGCDNENYASAYMDYSTGMFNYGDWKDAFFMQVKPCMLKYDGTVDYYLDPNDYSRKADGTASDITNLNYEGNVMVEFPKVYYKGVIENDNVATYYFSNKKLDSDYKCWSHLDENGEEIPYCYISAYELYYKNNKARSISGTTVTLDVSITNEINMAKYNSYTYTMPFCDYQLITLLLMLIGKNTDTQKIFGNGAVNNGKSWASQVSDYLPSGRANSKGLFWGSNAGKETVKVFGIENIWGNTWRVINGYVLKNGNLFIKMTSDYNTTGDGYDDTNVLFPTSTNGYIKTVKLNPYYIIPKSIGASTTTYYPDAWMYNTGNIITIGGGLRDSSSYLKSGIFATVNYATTGNGVNIFLSCKPTKEV